MAFCGKCGTQVEDGKGFCPSCGNQVGAPAQQAAPSDNNFQNTMQNMMNTPNSTSEFDQADIESNKVMAIIAYIGLLFLIINILAAPNSKFARFHANQGLVLFIASIVLGFIPVLGWLASVALMIMGIVNAAQGQAKELPFIGKFRILK